jgi:YrbI family 3-deoxy-D-manno-octulosonate 8-phosphate phosphatase
MIKLVILDVDGVMTDGIKYYDRDGKVVLKTFCDKDWTAIKRLRAIGIDVVFITGDPYNEMILKNRNLPTVVNRGEGFHRDKINFLPEVLEKYNCSYKEAAYLGDDLFDYMITKGVRYKFCVADSPRALQDICSVLPCKGGENAIMHFFEVLEERALIPIKSAQDVMDKIYELDIQEKF